MISLLDYLFHTNVLLDDYSVCKDAYIGVAGDKIAYIGAVKPDMPAKVTRVKPKGLMMPGLYNTHTHAAMTLLRGVGSDLPLERWLHEAIFPIEGKLTEADISVGTRLAMLEMLASGVVSFTDMYDMPWVTAEEVMAAGMRANLCRPILGFDPAEGYADSFRVRESLQFYDEFHGAADGKIRVDFGIHAEYTSHEGIVRPYGEDCLRRGAVMHLHLSETVTEVKACQARNGGRTPVEWFSDLGVLQNPTVAAHCVALSAADMDILQRSRVWAVHNPTSNLKLASGFMPLQDLQKRGVKAALGTDGAASNNNLNMFEEMHLAALIHKGNLQDAEAISPRDVLEMATKHGALAQGREHCGALTLGAQADMILLDLDRPHLMPQHDILALLVYAAQASDVVMTMVGGKILYENGIYQTIDVERVRFDLEASEKRLF